MAQRISRFEHVEEKDFTTMKSVQELSRILNDFVRQTNAKVESLEMPNSPIPSNEPRGEVEVVLYGKSQQGVHGRKLPVGVKEWTVQVYIFDFGDHRYVNTIAVGKSGLVVGLDVAINGLHRNDHADIKDSQIMQDRIIAALNEGDTSVQNGFARLHHSENDDTIKNIEYSSEVLNSAPPGSLLFSRMVSLKDRASGSHQIDLEYNAIKSFLNQCMNMAQKHPDFPAHDQLMAYMGHKMLEGLYPPEIFQRYMEKYPNLIDAAIAVIDALFTWKDRFEVDTALMMAGFSFMDSSSTIDDVNAYLERVMQLQLNGDSIDSVQEQLWLNLAWLHDFGEWYVQRYKNLPVDAKIIKYSNEMEKAGPLGSDLFGRMVFQKYNFSGKSLFRYENAAINSFLDFIEVFLQKYPDFPARKPLMACFGIILDDDCPEKATYQPYIDAYPDLLDARMEVGDCLDNCNLISKVDSALLSAGFGLIDWLNNVGNPDRINGDLELVMWYQLDGAEIDIPRERLWIHLAWLCDFGVWYYHNKQTSNETPASNVIEYHDETRNEYNCPNCGMVVDSHMKFCIHCGKPLSH